MKCAGCRRQLRTEESRRRGLGPTCWARLAPEQRAEVETPAVRPVRVAASPAQIPHAAGQLAIAVVEPLPDFVPGLCGWGEAGGGQPARACSLPTDHGGACRLDRKPTRTDEDSP